MRAYQATTAIGKIRKPTISGDHSDGTNVAAACSEGASTKQQNRDGALAASPIIFLLHFLLIPKDCIFIPGDFLFMP